MTATPRPMPGRLRESERLVGTGVSRPRRLPTPGRIARRRFFVRSAKWLLPLLALGLLSLIGLWPEIVRQEESARIAFRRVSGAEVEASRMTDPRYRSVDEHDRPYTVTADVATQISPQRVNLTQPKADVTLENGTWLMVQGKQGVYIQHLGQLDLSGDVTLYRQDGTVMVSDTATTDMKLGGASSNDRTHAEGPFGTLDAQGFTITDKGDVVQFTGPAHMLLNAAEAKQ